MICPCQHIPKQLHSPLLVKQPVHDKSLKPHQYTYAECCQVFHDMKSHPKTAEQLMRSRYSAFVLEHIPYIVATTLPAQQHLLDQTSLFAFAKQTDWCGLEVVHHKQSIGKHHAQVEFKAFFNTDDGLGIHHELSSFVLARPTTGNLTEKTDALEEKGSKEKYKVQRQWYFLDPTLAMKVTQKQPCICGNGEKYKRCCGVYLAY